MSKNDELHNSKQDRDKGDYPRGEYFIIARLSIYIEVL